MCAESPTAFVSLLYRAAEPDDVEADAALHDLALDRVFAHLAEEAPRAAAALRRPLATGADVVYRQEVFRQLERASLATAVRAFLAALAGVDGDDRASAAAHDGYAGELWHLRAVVAYTEAVEALRGALDGILTGTASAAWTGLRAHLAAVVDDPVFARRAARARALAARIGGIRYNALVRGGKVTIAPFDDEDDLGESVRDVFARFDPGADRAPRADAGAAGIDHVQAWMLALAARVHPEPFAELTRFAAATASYRDPVLERVADEVRFCLAYLDHLAPLRAAGLAVCYPEVSTDPADERVTGTWDLALAPRRIADGGRVITNDYALTGDERILVVSGPNQGGKTTFARTFGQLHHLASVGCPVAAGEARLLLSDRVLTVFAREESLDTLEGRLGDEVRQVHAALDAATSRSILVLNEPFAGTALHDARILTRDVLQRIGARDARAVCVTFIDELSRLDARTVSLVAVVDPADPVRRTFRIERRRADGRAYARALAAAHGLDPEGIAARVAARMPEEAVAS